VISIDTLPDEVLLAIFDFCVEEDQVLRKSIEAWQLLVHVCRRWRSIIFGSPLRLNLQLVGTPKTPVKDTLDIWPLVLPLVIHGSFPPRSLTEGLDNIIELLEHRHRVCQIFLDVSSPQFEEVAVALQVPFPELTNLQLSSYDKAVLSLRNSFLGGSAPRLRKLQLGGISFPGLPRLLLTAPHLVELHLCDIPYSGYISPEIMVVVLSALINLKSFSFQFKFPDGRRRPSPTTTTRTVLPVLTHFRFKGLSQYLEDLVSRIDAPLLYTLYVDLFDQIGFDTTKFTEFFGRTPKLKVFKEARFNFDVNSAWMDLSTTSSDSVLNVTVSTVSCGELDMQLMSLGQVCTLSLPPLSTPEDVYICEAPGLQPDWDDDLESEGFENTLWPALLRPFVAMRNLYLSKDIAPRIFVVLEETVICGKRVLPTLQNIFLEELELSRPIQDAMGKFVAARQATGHPIAVSRWERWRDS
jgi:hypothetical protein